MKHLFRGATVALLATAAIAVSQPPSAPAPAPQASGIVHTHSGRYADGDIVTVNWHADKSTSSSKIDGSTIHNIGQSPIPQPPVPGDFAAQVEAAYQSVAGTKEQKQAFAGYFGQVYTSVGEIVAAGGLPPLTDPDNRSIVDKSRADVQLTKAYEAAPGGAASWIPFKVRLAGILNTKGNPIPNTTFADAKVIGGLLQEIGTVLTSHAPADSAAAMAASGQINALMTGMDAIVKNLTPGDIELWIRLFELLLPLLIKLFGLFNAVASTLPAAVWV